MAHAVREARSSHTPAASPEAVRRANPDLKPSRQAMSEAVGAPFSQWVAGENAGKVVKRHELVSLLAVMVRPLQEETARLHRALYLQQQRSVLGLARRVWRWLAAKVQTPEA